VVVGQQDENGVVSAGDMRVMTDVSPKASIFVLAGNEPFYDFLFFSRREGLLESSKGGE